MKHLFLFLIIFLVFISCCDDEISFGDCIAQLNPKQSDPEFIAYAENRIAWECSKLSNYSVEIEYRGGRCLGKTIEYFIIDGMVDSLNVLRGGTANTMCPAATIDEIFDFIEFAVDETSVIPNLDFLDEEIFRADDIRVDYDSVFFYPKTALLNYVSGIADEEFSVILTEFKITE